MAIIKRAKNIEKIAYKKYVIKAKELNKISDRISIETFKDNITVIGGTKVNIKANNS